jgi:hypothetical protein
VSTHAASAAAKTIGQIVRRVFGATGKSHSRRQGDSDGDATRACCKQHGITPVVASNWSQSYPRRVKRRFRQP